MKDKDLSRRAARGDRLIREHLHAPYKTRLKLTEPTVCPQCGAVYHEGRWHWAERPDQAQEALCQACHRSNERDNNKTIGTSPRYVSLASGEKATTRNNRVQNN